MRKTHTCDILALEAHPFSARGVLRIEEMGLRFLYSLRPCQPFLDVVLAYLLKPNFFRTTLKG